MALPFLSASRKLVAGINLPFVLELMIAKKNGTLWEDLDIENMIENAKSSMVFYNKLLKTEENIMIKLVRVDHRLLHGQVIFSWTKQMSVNYIIVADDKVPNDPISVMALNIAKPVDCELSIIPFSQLKRLVEEKQSKNIMILVKGPEEALRLIEELPEVTEINYGGVAKKSDSKQYGKAIFLNPQELKATQEIIAKGKKVYIQMVPTSQIESADFSK